jgi:hypothetical protein
LLVGAAGRGPVGGAGDGGKAEELEMAGEGTPGKGDGIGEVGRPRLPFDAEGPMGGRGDGREALMAGEAMPGPATVGGGIITCCSFGGPAMVGVGGAPRPS